MSDSRNPVDDLLDRFLFGPIGLMTSGKDRVPDLAQQGRQQLALFKMVGRYAVSKATKEVSKRLNHDSGAATSPKSPTTPSEATSASNDTHDDPDEFDDVDIPVRRDEPTLAIDGYDTLAASQIVTRLAHLSADELAEIATYEMSHRHRKTILGKIAQLQDR